MIRTETNLGPVFIVQDVAELPDVPLGTKTVYCDVETTSFDPKVAAFLPYNGHRVCGIAITWDDLQAAYYIPLRHTDDHWNVDLDEAMKWLTKNMKRGEMWRNHNLHFDAHFLRQDGFEWEGLWGCSLTEAKLLNSERFNHQLKDLCRDPDWTSLPMEEELEVKAYLKGLKSKDWANVPGDVLGKYAGMDVLGNRTLCQFIDSRFDESMLKLRDQERKLTPVLYDIEIEGLRADRVKLMTESVLTARRIITMAGEIASIIGFEFTDSNKVLTQILCGQYSLPVLSYKKVKDDDGNWSRGNASFDKDALELYLVHDEVLKDPALLDLVQLIVKYRKENTFFSLFLSKYMELADDGYYLHPMYNQNVRTGRMSCSNPNSQQLNKRAKQLIIPPQDEGFLSADASQVEFRIIVHYIDDQPCIEAYANDPKTDFHQWVADMAQSGRSEGKTLNFAVAFGQGKKTCIANLSVSPGIVAQAMAQIPNAPKEDLIHLCRKLAADVYDRYHSRLPGIKLTSWDAQAACRARGYVFNLFGRRRNLPYKAAHKAFNAIVQGSASDYVKSRMNALAPRYNDRMRRWNIRIAAQVHDEILFVGPRKILREPEVQAYINTELETVPVPLKVPLLWDMGYSETSWSIAAGDDIVTNSNGVQEGRILVA